MLWSHALFLTQIVLNRFLSYFHVILGIKVFPKNTSLLGIFLILSVFLFAKYKKKYIHPHIYVYMFICVCIPSLDVYNIPLTLICCFITYPGNIKPVLK